MHRTALMARILRIQYMDWEIYRRKELHITRAWAVSNDPSYDFSVIDCGLLSQNIMLSGHALGVGSVCLGSPVRFLRNAPEAIAKLGFSEGYTPVICIGMGYPDEAPEAKPRDFGKVKFVD